MPAEFEIDYDAAFTMYMERFGTRFGERPEGAFVKDAERNYFTSLVAGGKGKHVAFVGVSDLVVVETDDAVLVMPRERAQDVKLVVEALKKAGKTELL